MHACITICSDFYFRRRQTIPNHLYLHYFKRLSVIYASYKGTENVCGGRNVQIVYCGWRKKRGGGPLDEIMDFSD